MTVKVELEIEVMGDFATYELAVKLAEKGFDYETRDVYERNALACRYEDIPKPTIYQVLKWLREEKGLHICISLGEFIDWEYEISLIDGNIFCAACEDSYSSYEQAALAGVVYVLDNLI